jgi:TonB family protein
MSAVLLNMLAALASGVAATTSIAPPAPSLATVTRMPNDVEMVFAFPRSAYRARISGTASVECLLDDHAVVETCAVVSEQPASQGFGAAALQLVPYMSFSVPTSTEGAVSTARFTITFDNPRADKWPDFLSVPTADELRGPWPSNTTGQVRVGCRIETDGTPDSCEVLAPPNASAAMQAAAVQVMTGFKFSPAIRDGQPIPAVVIVPFQF